ncbi:MAG: radical SAM protein [Parabacteroides sp.]|nr:radical SAM protein [Parabacteroides sp.]
MHFLQDINPIERALVDKATANRVPINASFELTPVCNLRCDMCYVRMEQSRVAAAGGVCSLREWLHAADALQRMGTLFILLTGGEPLLYPDFKELYVRLKERGFILTINTNATLIDDEMARLFQRLKPRRVNVSLYGVSNETYQALCHVPQGFDRCMEGLRRLKAYGIDTKLNLTLTRQNIKEHRQMLALADELEMPALTNSYLSVYSRADRSAEVAPEACRPIPSEVARAEVDALRHKYGRAYAAYVDQLLRQLEQPESPAAEGVGLTCRAGKSSVWINWQGLMTPCVDMDVLAVSLRSTAVADAWARIVADCEALPLHHECAGCSLRPLCDVCYANATNERSRCGDLSYLCQIAKSKKAEILLKT